MWWKQYTTVAWAVGNLASCYNPTSRNTDESVPRCSGVRQLSDADAAHSPEELKLAYKAFKKRLKLTRLDAESKVGGSPLSGGSGWGIAAIVPPNQYPDSVWEELVKQGKLKRAGHGLYSLGQP